MKNLIKRYHDMISINSTTENEKELALYIQKELSELGIKSSMLHYQDDTACNSPTVFAEIKGKRPGKNVLFTGHIDTVPVTDSWTKPPYRATVEGDKTYGRGAMDMKGGLAAVLEVAEYFQKNKDEMSGSLLFAFLSDEEYLSRGCFRFIEEKIPIDVALMAECRYDNVAIGFRGRLTIDVEVYGKAVHSSQFPHDGENAILMAVELGKAIQNLPVKKYGNISEGSWCLKNISGGLGTGLTVPPVCKMDFDRFTVPGESADEIVQQINDLAKDLEMEGKVKASLRERALPYMDPFAIDIEDKSVTVLAEIYKKIDGNELHLEYDRSCCDSNIIAKYLDIPIVTFGPSGGNMHGDDEYGYQYQVENCAKIYIEWAKEMLK